MDGGDPRWPRRGTAKLAASRASGGPWIGGEEERVEAELASTARGRGGEGGRGVTVARLRLRSGK